MPPLGLKVDEEHLQAIENAQTESDVRDAQKAIGRDHRLAPTIKEALMEAGRLRIAQIGKQATLTEKGAGAPVSTTSLPAQNAPAPSKAPLGHALKDLVEAEIEEVEGKPVHLTVREPALPVIDAASLGVALKMWQQLGLVIEANTPEALVAIQGKKWRTAEFWRAARLAYGCDKPVLESQVLDYTNGRATIVVRLSMGRRIATCIAVAERSEKGKADAPMNTLAGLAYTRALNRASREVIGLGTKSAEEVDADD